MSLASKPFAYLTTFIARSLALITSLITWSRRGGDGQGLAEYALILALIAVVAITALLLLGTQISSILDTVGEAI